MRRSALFCTLAAAVLATGPAPAAEARQAATSTVSRGRVDGEAVRQLNEMSAYLRTLTRFEVSTTTALEQAVDDTGAKATVTGTATYRVRRPDGFYVEVSSDRQKRQFWYDGKTFTVFAPAKNFYAQVPAPPTIKDTLDAAYADFGIALPLADLFYWGVDDLPADALKSAGKIGGTVVINGVNTDHYIFSGADLSWQIWIQQGDKPLPRKVIITTLDDPARPSYSADLTWKVAPAPAFTPASFTFKPPAAARPIGLAKIGE